MGRPAKKEVERVESARDLDERAEVEAAPNTVEADEGSAAARGFALAILVSAMIWLVCVVLIFAMA